MKTRLIQLSKSLFIFFIFFGCNTDSKLKEANLKLKQSMLQNDSLKRNIKEIKENCNSCKKRKIPFNKKAYEEEIHYKLDINCDKIDEGQYFRSDYKNGYIILGKIKKCNNGYLEEVEFELIQAGCNNLRLKEVQWLPYKSPLNPNITHAMLFNIIDTDKPTEAKNKFLLQFDEGMQFDKENLTTVVITSNNSDVGYNGDEGFPDVVYQINEEIECPKITWKG